MLDILPLSRLVLHNVFRIVWAGDRPYTVNDIRLFAKVRRDKVLTALLWLKHNNILYRDVAIDFNFLQQWEDKFVPTGIVEHIVECGPNHFEKQGYCTDLEANNFEDNFYAAVDQTGSDNSILGGCVYTDACQTREHPTSKLLSAIANNSLHSTVDLETAASAESETVSLEQKPNIGHQSPLVTYRSQGHAMPLNDWDNPFFFTAAFLTLFPWGTGGHLCRTRQTPLSIETWVRWALNYHCRR